MRTYRGDKDFKAQFVATQDEHRKLDEIKQGTYGEQNGHWRGCWLACSLRTIDQLEGRRLKVRYGNHRQLELKGVAPEWLSWLGGRIFEGLPAKDAPQFVVDLSKAIPDGLEMDGVEMNRVKWRFLAFLMKENIKRVEGLNISTGLKDQVLTAIHQVLAVLKNAIRTGVWDASASASARSAAESAWWSAASARSAEYARQAKKLIELLKKA